MLRFLRLGRVRLGLATCVVLLGALATLPLCGFLFVAYRAELNHVRADALAAQRRAVQASSTDVQWRLDALAAQLRLVTRLARLPDPGLQGDLLPRALLEVSSRTPGGQVASTAEEATVQQPVLSPFGSDQGRQVAYLSVVRMDPGGTGPAFITGKIALAGLLPDPGAGPQVYLLDQQGQYAPAKAPGHVIRSSAPLMLADGPRLRPSGWAVAVADRPEELAQREAELKLRYLVGGALSLCIGLALLHVVARLMRNEIEDVVTDFGEFGDTAANSVISEFAQIGGALASARAKAGHTARELERAKHDFLTGLPGRELFLQRAREQIDIANRAEDLGVAVIYIDLDGFKDVNDQRGHKAGDEVLQRVASALQQCVRSPDALGRLGGDEFAVCFAAPRESLSELAERTAARITEAVTRLGGGVGCSAGWAIALSSCNLLELIDEADAAMYLAKAYRKRSGAVEQGEGGSLVQSGGQ